MDWNHVYSNLKHLANRAAVKINQTADIATLGVKVSMAEKRLEEAYAALGRVAYEHFTSDEDHSERVASAVSGVNDALLALRMRQTELEEAKRRAEQSSARAEAVETAQTFDAEDEESEAVEEAPVQKEQETVIQEVVSSYSDADDTVEIAVEETL